MLAHMQRQKYSKAKFLRINDDGQFHLGLTANFCLSNQCRRSGFDANGICIQQQFHHHRNIRDSRFFHSFIICFQTLELSNWLKFKCCVHLMSTSTLYVIVNTCVVQRTDTHTYGSSIRLLKATILASQWRDSILLLMASSQTALKSAYKRGWRYIDKKRYAKREGHTVNTHTHTESQSTETYFELVHI